jgi:thioredoxin reductase
LVELNCLSVNATVHDELFDVAIVGAGPAGLATAVYALERKVGQLTMELDLLKKTPRRRLVSDNENSSIISGQRRIQRPTV